MPPVRTTECSDWPRRARRQAADRTSGARKGGSRGGLPARGRRNVRLERRRPRAPLHRRKRIDRLPRPAQHHRPRRSCSARHRLRPPPGSRQLRRPRRNRRSARNVRHGVSSLAPIAPNDRSRQRRPLHPPRNSHRRHLPHRLRSSRPHRRLLLRPLLRRRRHARASGHRPIRASPRVGSHLPRRNAAALPRLHPRHRRRLCVPTADRPAPTASACSSPSPRPPPSQRHHLPPARPSLRPAPMPDVSAATVGPAGMTPADRRRARRRSRPRRPPLPRRRCLRAANSRGRAGWRISAASARNGRKAAVR